MSKRRQMGDILVKKENAGFVGEKLIVRIPSLETFNREGFPYQDVKEDQDCCLMNCGDPDCIEYANLEVLDENFQFKGWCCHVSECQLEEYKGKGND